MRKIIIGMLLLVIPLLVWGQESLAWPIIQTPHPWTNPPYSTVTFDTLTVKTTIYFDYLFVDTTGNRVSPYFGGAPFLFNWIMDSTNGLATDSMTIACAFLTQYDAVLDSFYMEGYDNAGTTRTVTIWSNYDWTNLRRYNYRLLVNYPCWGVRFGVTCTQVGTSSTQGHKFYHWGIRQ